MKSEESLDLLSSMVERLTIDYSTRCNLRCSYCHTGNPSHVDLDMTEKMLEDLHDYCEATEVRSVWLSSMGETTMYLDWHEKLSKFLDDERYDLHINSNFARSFSETDLLALSKLAHIQISVDSSSPELMKKQRTASLDCIIANIVRLQQIVMASGGKTRLHFNCVVTRDNITHISGLARLALILKISVLMLTEVGNQPDNPRMPDCLSKLTDEEASQFALSVLDAGSILSDSPVDFYIQPELKAKLAPIIEAINQGKPVSAATFRGVEERQLDLGPCLMPWDTVMVFANGDVPPCCGRSVGTNGNVRERDLIDIVDGQEARAFRARLLRGEPGLPCETCNFAREITPDNFRKQVRARHERFAREHGPVAPV